MNTIDSIINELLELMDKKSALFNNIMEITLEQKKDIGNGAENMGKLIKEKQTIIDSVDKIDALFSERINVLKNQLKVNTLEDIDSTKYPMMKSLKNKVDGIMSQAAKIMEIEESNKKELTKIMDDLKKEMKQMKVGRKSLKAYDTPVINSDGIYIDRRK